jgi:hypothetical protein
VAKLIGEFLLDLEKHHHFKDFQKDPKKVLKESGLSEEQQEILLSNDLHRIREAIHHEYREAKVIVVPLMMMNVSVGGTTGS